jgi:3',5'-cyclic-AMP phosphodiesterase
MKTAPLVLALVACTRPAEDRAPKELEIGGAELRDATVTVVDGLAAIHTLTDRDLVLRANAPAIDLLLDLQATAAGPWTVTAKNVLVDSVLVVDGVPVERAPVEGASPTVARFEIGLGEGRHELRLAPPDADEVASFQFAAMADIQTAMPEVDDVFRAISDTPGPRFVVFMGDITQRAEIEEFDLFDRQLEALDVPIFTTLGNHELWAEPERYFERYGRASFQFRFKGAAFTFADSGDAGLDPIVEGWLDEWLAGAKDELNVFLTHIPPLDPVGVRYGAFRSARDGHRLVSRLVENQVDLALYGHIHTYEPYDNAGVPSFISGGGGADPMKLDGIDRHFLVVTLDPVASTVGDVTVHRVPD